MSKLTLTAATAALLGAAGLAHAQDAAAPGEMAALPANLIEVENDAMVVEPFGVTVDELEDADIHDQTGERIGEVEEVLMTADDGQVVAVAAEIGGFLGIGDDEVAVPLDRLTWEGDGTVRIDLTEDQAKSLPAWDD